MSTPAPERVAIIGGGITGVFAAEELGQAGYDVSIFDQHADLIDGTSRYPLTIHSGPEYTGDLPTALECIQSAIDFKKRVPEGSGKNSVNYVVAADSPLTMDDFTGFMDRLAEHYASFPAEDQVLGRPETFYRAYDKDHYPYIKQHMIEGGIVGQDVTFNMDKIRQRVLPMLGRYGIKAELESEVKEVKQVGDRFMLDYVQDGESKTEMYDQVVNTGGYRAIMLDRHFGDRTPYALNFKTFHLVAEADPLPAFAIVRGPYMIHSPYPQTLGYNKTISALNAAGSPEGSIIRKFSLDPQNPHIPADIDEIMLSGKVPNAERRVESIMNFASQFVDINRFTSLGLVPGVAVSFKMDEHARGQTPPRELVPGYYTAVTTKATHAPTQSREIRTRVVSRSLERDLAQSPTRTNYSRVS